jgi:hypothetical protein
MNRGLQYNKVLIDNRQYFKEILRILVFQIYLKVNFTDFLGSEI